MRAVTFSLVRIREAPHTTHHAEHIVVRRIHAHLGARRRAHRVVGHRQQQRRVVNAGQVARAAGLVLLRGEREGIHVDAHRRHVRVVLVGLHQVKVVTLTHREAVVAVELDERRHHGVLARHALHAGHGVARLQARPVPPVRVVERLLALPGVHHRVIARHEGIALHHPHELLARVVEVQLELVGGGVDGLRARELEHVDEVLVGHLGELAALVRVQVDVVHIEGRRHQVGRVHAVADHVHVRVLGRIVPAEVLEVVELEVDAHLVVLEGDQGQRKARVAAEPELEGHIQRVLGRAAEQLARRVGLATRAAVVAVLTALHDQVGQVGHVAHHLGVARLLARLLGELIPDLEPVTVVLVDALAADLELHPVDEVVANPVEPAELGTRAVSGLELHGGERRLEIHAVDQVAVALDRARHLVVKPGVAVEGILDGLHREVRVATVNRLEEGDLGITRQIHVLSTIGHELH